MTHERALFHDSGWIPWQNPFGLIGAIKKETGGGGKCQFSSIAESLYPTKDWDSKRIRQVVADEVLKMSRDDFKEFIQDYRREKEAGEFQGDWDPDKVTSRRQFAAFLTEPIRTGSDMSFWGDSRTLVLFARARNIRIYLLSLTKQKSGEFRPNVWCCETFGKTPDFAIMLWFSGGHYQPVGVQYLDGKRSIWKLHEIPREISTFTTSSYS